MSTLKLLQNTQINLIRKEQSHCIVIPASEPLKSIKKNLVWFLFIHKQKAPRFRKTTIYFSPDCEDYFVYLTFNFNMAQ